MAPPPAKLASMKEFYTLYLSQHSNRTSRRLHFVGSSLAIMITICAVLFGKPWLIAVAVVQGYMLAWIGHFFFERNRPATFTYPIYSLIGDWWMWFDIVRGRVKF